MADQQPRNDAAAGVAPKDAPLVSDQATYSVGTWSPDRQAYTPQVGCSIWPQWHLTRSQLRTILRELRQMGYTAHRVRSADGGHDDNDYSVLVERTDGRTAKEMRRAFRR